MIRRKNFNGNNLLAINEIGINLPAKTVADNEIPIELTGKFAGSETDINPVRLPEAAREYVTENLHAAIKEASLNKDAEGTITFEADLKGKAYIFDEKGNFIKTEKGD